MTTRAKFYINGLTLLPGNGGVRVDMSAVSRGDRNAEWAAATPIGTLSMTIQNPPAVTWWENFMNESRKMNKQPEMWIDIRPSEDGWAGDGHAFRLGSFPEGHYAHGKCGECGQGADDDLTEWDAETRAIKVIGKVHPNG